MISKSMVFVLTLGCLLSTDRAVSADTSKSLDQATAVDTAKPLKVVTSTTDVAWAARQIGGKRVEVTSLLTGYENAHYVDAVPKYIRLAAEADVVCVVGLELEIGWMPKVLAKTGRSQVQPGGSGYCELGTYVHPIEKPSGPVNRSMGHVHAVGNPHFWLDPIVFGKASRVIVESLVRVDPVHKEYYEKNYQGLQSRLKDLAKRSRSRVESAVSADKRRVVQYHANFSYFLNAVGLELFGNIEDIPGQHPSAGRLAKFGLLAKAKGVEVGFAAEYDPKSVLDRFSEISSIKILSLPESIKPNDPKLDSYEKLIEQMTARYIQAAQGRLM